MKRVCFFVMFLLLSSPLTTFSVAKGGDDAVKILSFFPHAKKVEAGKEVFLYWVAENADACTLKWGETNTQELPIQGLFPVTLETDTLFRLTCFAQGREDVEKSAVVIIEKDVETESYLRVMLSEAFDLGHFLNHLVYEKIFEKAVVRLAPLVVPAVLAAFYHRVLGQPAHAHGD